MYKIFSKNETYRFPNGKTMLGSDMVKMESYAILNSGVFAVDNTGNILRSFTPLEQLAEQYGIEYTDDHEAVLSKVNSTLIKENQISMDRASSEEALYTVVRMYASTFTDEQALAVKDIYEPFEVGRTYKKDEFFTYNGELFKVNQAHASEAQWVPGEIGTESLYTKITLNEAGYPIWKQPTGAHDAYNIGDIVEYNGKLYKSKIDGNAYSPDAYPAGWEEYTES